MSARVSHVARLFGLSGDTIRDMNRVPLKNRHRTITDASAQRSEHHDVLYLIDPCEPPILNPTPPPQSDVSAQPTAPIPQACVQQTGEATRVPSSEDVPPTAAPGNDVSAAASPSSRPFSLPPNFQASLSYDRSFLA